MAAATATKAAAAKDAKAAAKASKAAAKASKAEHLTLDDAVEFGKSVEKAIRANAIN